MFDRKTFFDIIRPDVNLTTQNVFGTEKILTYAEQNNTPINDLAYILATAWWETAQTMTPITEYGSEAYLRSKRYWPYVGRGLIQVTWETNYRKVAKMLGLPEEYFVNRPEELLKWEYALPALFIGMQTGLYTGVDLDDYIDDIDESDEEDFEEYRQARRIVNGTDKRDTIGRLALTFERGLRASQENSRLEKPQSQNQLETPNQSWFVKLLKWIINLFKN